MGQVVVIAPGYAAHDAEARVASDHGRPFEVLHWENRRDNLLRGLTGADIAFVRDTSMDSEVVDAMAPGGGIVRYGVGIDRIDLDTATRKGIKIANIPDYGADVDVADHTLALFLAVVRRICTGDSAVRNGVWGIGQSAPIRRIAGRSLGLLGYGRIGRAVHARFNAFGVEKVLVHDPYLSAEAANRAGVARVSLQELAEQSDIVSLHAPPSDAGPIINADFIGLMRAGAVLLNSARGALVDEGALVDALAAGRLGGAGLDVFQQEPPNPDNPLLKMDNVVISDHAGWYSEASVQALQQQAAAEAERILSGSRPLNWVNPW